eukprot:CAMPEP_0194224278 /NCGR_PEP_ID=MMETSP0156-20130528/37050_1 /TAXON_ID=33649 /ORGANISM="Thalassionema nitzschioides, Strain L26-B" /LENGTH=42 /DNA_ID= /DNA_START= /DNA_END= /DNA_ORIENTATION=
MESFQMGVSGISNDGKDDFDDSAAVHVRNIENKKACAKDTRR